MMTLTIGDDHAFFRNAAACLEAEELAELRALFDGSFSAMASGEFSAHGAHSITVGVFLICAGYAEPDDARPFGIFLFLPRILSMPLLSAEDVGIIRRVLKRPRRFAAKQRAKLAKGLH